MVAYNTLRNIGKALVSPDAGKVRTGKPADAGTELTTLKNTPSMGQRLAARPGLDEQIVGREDRLPPTVESQITSQSPLERQLGFNIGDMPVVTTPAGQSAVVPTVPTLGLDDVNGFNPTTTSFTTTEFPSGSDNPDFPVVDEQQTRALDREKSELEAARAENQSELTEINERLEIVDDRIAEIDAPTDTDGISSRIADERDRLENEGEELRSDRADRVSVDRELDNALTDVNELLSVNQQVLENEEELERLESREKELERELERIPESRDISESPPTAVDGLIENQRESAENELKDVRRDQGTVSRKLQELRDPRTDDIVSIVIAQSDIALRQSALVAEGLSPDNSDVYTTTDAIGTVYLNPENRATVERLAEQYDVPPELLAGVVAAELDFDHTGDDRIQDGLGRSGLPGLPGIVGLPDIPIGEGVGAASVHEAALHHAIEELTGEEHGFQFNEDVLDQDYRSTFTGSVESAAIVLKHLMGEYGKEDNLSAQDMAQIWAGYRTGVQGVNELDGKYGFESVEDWRNGNADGAEIYDPQFSEGSNAHMSEPLFKFFAEQYN